MARKRTIVGLGEALLVEHPDRLDAAGIAAGVAILATRLGHRGVIISRVGQDRQADELLGLLGDRNVETTHVQSDPDLPTGRVTIRSIGRPIARHLEAPAAFDNLQADFDLEDVAQQADAVVFGVLTRRSGQTRSEENRFLEACAAAIRVFDLTNRGGGEHDAKPFDRRHAESGLDLSEIVLVDRVAIDAVRPQSASKRLVEAARDLRRELGAACVLAVDAVEASAGDGVPTVQLHAIGRDRDATVRIPTGRPALEATIVALLVGLLAGRDVDAALDVASRVGEHAHTRPEEPIPEEWFA